MSANNWRQCPKCLKQHETDVSVASALVTESYGKVPVHEYEKLRQEARDMASTGLDDTLREDYEIGITVHGEFYVGYRGMCDVCGLDFQFKHECDVLSAVRK